MNKILLVDDDEILCQRLQGYFEKFEHKLIYSTRPTKAQDIIGLDKEIDLIILDIMMPEMDGFEFCRWVRQHSTIPILFLSARGDVMDRIIGIELGADDFVAKPFEPRELLVRVQAIIKRSIKGTTYDNNEINFGDLKVNFEMRQVVVDGEEVQLTTKEFALLELFARNPGKNYSRDDILSYISGIDADIFSRSVDILVSRLRNKLKPTDYIKTNWGAGYCFIGKSNDQ